tara:strand:+ start:189 stop:332 length:144 start_codon:yes stop_codon:yes gene_type:complete
MKMKIIRSKGRKIPYSDIRKTFKMLLRQAKREGEGLRPPTKKRRDAK